MAMQFRPLYDQIAWPQFPELYALFPQVLYQASAETTAMTMEWAFSLLISHPDVMQKAQAEIDTIVGNSHLIEESEVAQLPYLRCIIKETLRLHPPAPFLLPHYSSEDCTVQDFRIPRRTTVLVNVWAIHNDPKIWAEPEKFMPERFEGSDGAKDDFKFMPFGSGRRGCPGETLAMRSVGLALGSLLQCFHWERITKEVDMTEGSGFFAAKTRPLMVKCIPRPNMLSLLSQI
jgi:cytochrome P450